MGSAPSPLSETTSKVGDVVVMRVNLIIVGGGQAITSTSMLAMSPFANTNVVHHRTLKLSFYFYFYIFANKINIIKINEHEYFTLKNIRKLITENIISPKTLGKPPPVTNLQANHLMRTKYSKVKFI